MKNIEILLITFIISSQIFASWDAVRSQQGMVSTADEYATQVGIDVLENGGNAVDAAVAVGFTLAVTYPQAGNIGGGGFMIIRTDDKNIFALDYREKAPKAAHRDLYLDENGKVKENASLIGFQASGVPGTVAGFYEAHKKFGSLPWKELVTPAIEYAENGFEINRFKENSLGYNHELFLKFESTRKIFTKNGEKFEEGDIFIQKDLAKSLKLVREKGKDGFYSGATANLIAGENNKNNGLITIDDLEDYQAVWREPIRFTYRGYEIFSMPPPSSGGIVLAEILNGLEKYDLFELGHNSSDLIHIWVEIERRAYADRAEFIGDADFFNVPVAKLISKNYALNRFKNINTFRASASSEIGNIKNIGSESEETTHFSIVDKWGNAVSNTYTLNASYGSGVVIEGTGILMNNEMDDFSIKAGVPNLYGLIGSEANEIMPEKRMLSSMTPTIITKNDSLYSILGSPGGSTIITTVAQVISNIIDHRMTARRAAEAPRFHHQWLPDEILHEEHGFVKDVRDNLKNKGHKLNKTKRIGDIQLILWNAAKNEWTGWSDPRGNGLTKGY